MNKKLAKELKSYLLIALGSSVYAFGYVMFFLPNQIPLGGIIGLATIFNTLFAAPLGITNILLNAPLLIGGIKMLGRDFFMRTIWAIFTASVMLDLLRPIVPAYSNEKLLACLYGAIIIGAGFGLVLKAGGSSGGTDVLAKFFEQKWAVNVGLTNLITNGVIIGANALVYWNIESAFYGIIGTYVTGIVMDKILYGGDVQKNAFIITNKAQEISNVIMTATGHGVTCMDAKGMYSGNERNVLMTVVKKHETSALKDMVTEVDPAAFMILSDATEVLGYGFKKYQSELVKKKDDKK